jgi:hypothetical protein
MRSSWDALGSLRPLVDLSGMSTVRQSAQVTASTFHSQGAILRLSHRNDRGVDSIGVMGRCVPRPGGRGPAVGTPDT